MQYKKLHIIKLNNIYFFIYAAIKCVFGHSIMIFNSFIPMCGDNTTAAMIEDNY